VQGPRPRPGLKEEGVLCCTVLVNCTDYGLVLLYGYGTEFCFGIGGGGGTGCCCERSLALIPFDE
jgi:hypothetical protein